MHNHQQTAQLLCAFSHIQIVSESLWLIQMRTQAGINKTGRNAEKLSLWRYKPGRPPAWQIHFPTGRGVGCQKRLQKKSAATFVTSGKKQVRNISGPWAVLLTEPSVLRKVRISVLTSKGSSTHLASECRKTGWSAHMYPQEIRGFVSTLNQWKAWRSRYKESWKESVKAKAEDPQQNEEYDGEKLPHFKF